jgi:hypothetical protein
MTSVPSQTICDPRRRNSWRRTSTKSREPIDALCMTQACNGALLDLHCSLEQWADHYEIPSEALRAMVSDIFVFERSGRPRLSFEELVAYANGIIAQEAAAESELTRTVFPEVLVEPDCLLKQGDVPEFHERLNDVTHPSSVEVLGPPSMAEWISNCAAGRPPGETPQLIGPETLFEKLKFCRSNIVNLEERISEEITSAKYEHAEETCQELSDQLHWMAEISEGVQDMDTFEYSNEPEEFEQY